MTIFGPADSDVRWVEMIHEADEGVFNTQANFFCRVEDALRGVFSGSKRN